MKLENQVTSLELSKKLKKLGVKQESLWSWYGDKGDLIMSNYDNEIFNTTTVIPYSAFTVAELGEMIKNKGWGYPIYVERDNKWHNVLNSDLPIVVENTEADARAKMLIYLIENKLME